MVGMLFKALDPLRGLGAAALDALLPQTCVSCGTWIAAGREWVCPACAGRLSEIRRSSHCPRCGRSMPTAAIHGDACASCRHEHFWNVAGVVRVGAYEPPLQRLLLGLKYHGRERNAALLAGLLAQALEQRGWSAELDYLVPVPMHWLRRRQRPCDHAGVLAAALGRLLGVPVLAAVKRRKHTPSQLDTTSRAARFENIKDCFAPGWRARRLRGRRVCIVDNLMATGATVCEMSKVLRRAGARRIHAAVVARSVMAGDHQGRPPAGA